MVNNYNESSENDDVKNNQSNDFQFQHSLYTGTISELENRLREFDDEIRRLLPSYEYSASNTDLLGRIGEEQLIEYLKLQQIVFLKKILVLNFKLNGNRKGQPRY